MIDTAALREKVLDLAIRGKLVPQDPTDEPASVLLERIHEQKLQMVREGKLKAKDVKDDTIIFKGDDNCYYEKYSDGSVKNIQDEIPFELPAGWAWSRLGFLAQYKKGPFGSSITKSMFVPDSNQAIKVYEQKNAIEKNAEIGRYFISQEKYKELRAFEIFPNDIIVSCAGTIGETFVMPHNMRKGIINQALMKISLYNLQIIDFYLIYFDFRLKSLANEQGYGVALKNIPPFDILKKYLVPIPPINEQYRIIKENENILNLIQQIGNNRNELNKIKTLLKSKILELAIQGKLVPQDKNDEPANVLLERIRADRKAKLGKKYVESYIFKGDDNCYYENNNGKVLLVNDFLPFDLPEEWAYVRLENVLNYEQPTEYIVESTDYRNEYKTPVLTAGKSFIIGYTNETTGIKNDLPVIIFDDFTTDSKFVNFPFKVKSSAMKILTADKLSIDTKYAYYVMQTVECDHETHKRYWISEYGRTIIGLPPLNEQLKIVNQIEYLFSLLDNRKEP